MQEGLRTPQPAPMRRETREAPGAARQPQRIASITATGFALGGAPGTVAVAGWSAGANVAAVTCQQARDAGGPAIAGQLLLPPLTNCDMATASSVENAEGYVLTAPLIPWTLPQCVVFARNTAMP